MKKILALVMALAMILSLAACGNSSSGSEAAPAAAASSAAKEEAAPAAAASSAVKEEAAPAAAASSAAEEEAAPAEAEGAATSEAADAWPAGNIKVLLPCDVGTRTDTGARIVCDWLAEQTGVEVIYTNDAAGGGAVLGQELIKAEPDGLTLFWASGANIGAYYQGNWDFNLVGNCTPICGATQPPSGSGCIIMTQADAPYSTIDELVVYVNEHPGEVTAACQAGSVMDYKMKSLFNYVGIGDKVRYVSGAFNDAIVNVLGGNVNVIIGEAGSSYGYIEDGSCKGIINCVAPDFDPATAYNDDQLKIITAIPTLADVYGADTAKDINIEMRQVVVGPPDMDPALVEKIANAINGIADDTGEYAERIEGVGAPTAFFTWPADELQEYFVDLDAKLAEIAG